MVGEGEYFESLCPRINFYSVAIQASKLDLIMESYEF
jgi:hypothetical protein